MKPPKSNVRFTKTEVAEREVARKVLDDATKSLWEQSRARGVLKRTLQAARDRAYARDDKVAVGGDNNPKIPALRYPEKPEDKAARERFLKAVAEGRVKSCLPREATAAVAAPETAPRATGLPELRSYVICPECLISTEFCAHFGRTSPNVATIADAHDRLEKFREELNEEERV